MTKTVAESILQGMKEALAHARGEIELPERIVITGRKFGWVPPDPERDCLPPDYVPEAEPEQHSPPKREIEGSNPSGDSNSDNL